MSPKATPWVFPDDAILPVIRADIHPLKRFGKRMMIWGIVIAGTMHLGAFGGWLIARNLKKEPPPAAFALEVSVKTIKSAADLGVPPSLAQEVAGDQIAVATSAVSSIGVPEPVPDFQAVTSTLATAEQIAEALTPVDVGDLRSDADSLVVDESMFDMDSDGPVSINAVEELPIAINTPAPEYPDMARKTGVEGAVRVRALITKEGKVAEVVVVEGNMLLEDAAVAAVKQWSFKPALQQHRPVAVWVETSLHFGLD